MITTATVTVTCTEAGASLLYVIIQATEVGDRTVRDGRTFTFATRADAETAHKWTRWSAAAPGSWAARSRSNGLLRAMNRALEL
jgi:hypothetical protein